MNTGTVLMALCGELTIATTRYTQPQLVAALSTV